LNEVPPMLLLIPGPVTTRAEVRAAMAQDIAPWDADFRARYSALRERLLRLAGGVGGVHAVLPLQGCGHIVTEAALRTFVPPTGRILVPQTGAYAGRMTRLARDSGREVVELPVPSNALLPADDVAKALAADTMISHVGLVYSETSTGVVHDAVSIGAVVRAAGRRMILDAVSAFGALPLDLAAQPEIEAAVFTANKCLEGMPGLGFAAARVDALMAAAGNAESWALDLADVYAHSLRNGWGTIRFTPPAQALAALEVALDLYEAEGGQPARLARYQANARALYQGFGTIGLHPYLPQAIQGPVVMNVHAPDDPAWSLQAFVDALKERGFLISNFYDTQEPSFRVGCIGAIGPDDMRRFISAVDDALQAMGIKNRAPSRQAA
jgi:2-aminoethylphosphonate-pyruvate transaminase